MIAPVEAFTSPVLASAAHHGLGAPSARRMPTEASAGEALRRAWPREAAFASEGAGGEPRPRGEGAKPTGAGCGAEPRPPRRGAARVLFEVRRGGLSSLDTFGITRRTGETRVSRVA